jgi:hypothetical protein
MQNARPSPQNAFDQERVGADDRLQRTDISAVVDPSDQRIAEAPRLLERHRLAAGDEPAAGRKLGGRNAAGDEVLHGKIQALFAGQTVAGSYRLNFLYLMRFGMIESSPSRRILSFS